MLIPQLPIESSYTFDGAELFFLYPEQVYSAFADFERFFLPIIEQEPYLCLDYIREALDENRAQLWGLRKGGEIIGIMVTQIEQYEHCKKGILWMVSGEGIQAGFEAFRAVIEPWFIDNGCRFIEVRGRKGWAKVIPEYSNIGIILRKEIHEWRRQS